MTPYDQVAYPSHPHPQTHPDRLATIAALFGVRSAPVGRCRVLELGCGNGSNLAPMAWSLPESEFVGIDLAGSAIASGQQMANELGLKNLRLTAGDILKLEPGWEQFDYILAHGVYSWVPAAVRDHILTLAKGCLSEVGVAFVSYGAFPGCHLRNMLREMMLFHVQGFQDPDERVNQATAFVRFMAQDQDVADPYRQWMKAELERILEHDPGHLYHDDLAELNQPFYFSQFISHAARHDLQFLGEADFFEMSDRVFSPSVRETLNQLSRNRILREQYLDFLKCRRFRQTLLCHRGIQLAGAPLSEAIGGLFVSSSLTCRSASVDLQPGVCVQFEAPRGAKAETDLPLGKAALSLLSERSPACLSFAQLLEESERRLNSVGASPAEGADHAATLREFLLSLYGAGVIELRSCVPACTATVSEKPVASPVARWQIQRGPVVTSGLHLPVQVQDEVGRHLLKLLDGTRTRSKLVDDLYSHLRSRGENAEAGLTRDSIAADLERNLTKLARIGLLVH